jgi:hypothetical protein
MKAHTVTYNLFTHTLDHVVNGNTLIFIKIFVFPLLLVTFLIIIGLCQQFLRIRELIFSILAYLYIYCNEN